MGPPSLAVEVISYTSKRTDRLQKRRLYQEEGVPEYWIVDPDERRVERWRPRDETPEVLSVFSLTPPVHPSLSRRSRDSRAGPVAHPMLMGRYQLLPLVRESLAAVLLREGPAARGRAHPARGGAGARLRARGGSGAPRHQPQHILLLRSLPSYRISSWPV